MLVVEGVKNFTLGSEVQPRHSLGGVELDDHLANVATRALAVEDLVIGEGLKTRGMGLPQCQS